MTGAQMTTAGLTVFGVNWKSGLAVQVGVPSSKVDRWSKDIGLPTKVYTQRVIASKLRTTW
jgi:hypothetical protein